MEEKPSRGLPTAYKGIFSAGLLLMGHGATTFAEKHYSEGGLHKILALAAAPFMLAGFYYGIEGTIITTCDLLLQS